ncbi:MAG: hypothetical protein ACI9TH_001274 [Kiritimatiellia bacterium]|jgi:hypothetical protein
MININFMLDMFAVLALLVSELQILTRRCDYE